MEYSVGQNHFRMNNTLSPKKGGEKGLWLLLGLSNNQSVISSVHPIEFGLPVRLEVSI